MADPPKSVGRSGRAGEHTDGTGPADCSPWSVNAVSAPREAFSPRRRPEPLTVAFVGQSVYFRQCALERPVAGIAPAFIDFRAGASPNALRAALARVDPDVVLVFRPEIVPEGLFSDLRSVTIGYLTEPLPRAEGDSHPDLCARLSALQRVDPGGFDRIVCFDPLIAQTASRILPVWRSLPIPVADGLFMDPRPRRTPPRLLFIGRSTEHREWMLAPIKRNHLITHIGHGLFGEALQRMLASSDVQINLHNNPYPTFENRVCIALAAGHLVISEPLSPSHGLRAGVDYLQVQTPRQLAHLAEQVRACDGACFEVQLSGRREAERFRASRVYPELFRDVVEDVREKGSARRIGASASKVREV